MDRRRIVSLAGSDGQRSSAENETSKRGIRRCDNAARRKFPGHKKGLAGNTHEASPVAGLRSAALGRSLTLHEAEPLLQELRRAKKTPEGRAKLRERVAVEHALAHVCNRQGPRARYTGSRKNTLDVRRTAAITNLHVLQRKAA